MPWTVGWVKQNDHSVRLDFAFEATLLRELVAQEEATVARELAFTSPAGWTPETAVLARSIMVREKMSVGPACRKAKMLMAAASDEPTKRKR